MVSSTQKSALIDLLAALAGGRRVALEGGAGLVFDPASTLELQHAANVVRESLASSAMPIDGLLTNNADLALPA